LAAATGVDLSEILGGKTKILGEQKVVNARAILNYWGARARAAPKVYAYGNCTQWSALLIEVHACLKHFVLQ